MRSQYGLVTVERSDGESESDGDHKSESDGDGSGDVIAGVGEDLRKYLDTVVLGAATHNDVGSGPRIITDSTSIFLFILFIEILSTSLSFLYDP